MKYDYQGAISVEIKITTAIIINNIVRLRFIVKIVIELTYVIVRVCEVKVIVVSRLIMFHLTPIMTKKEDQRVL
ncbi:hypothetical protein HanPSC8_Chr16g0701031 [Helianthus annuus]|nr:hypothetical protein HanPSC8_Chr16g0701031 [Helianthus annuus]